MARVRYHLHESGRQHLVDEGAFPFELILTRARTPEQIVETTLRWQDAGGTGVSVLTQKAGLATIDEHADYLHRVMAALGSAGTR